MRGQDTFLNCFKPGEYIDESGYTPALTDHYFLTEPEEFLYTHFPLTTSRTEAGDYSRWQLVTSPISLARFNRRPLLGSEFFTLGCDLITEVGTPILAEDKTEIEIHADEVFFLLQTKCGLSPFFAVSFIQIQVVPCRGGREYHLEQLLSLCHEL